MVPSLPPDGSLLIVRVAAFERRPRVDEGAVDGDVLARIKSATFASIVSSAARQADAGTSIGHRIVQVPSRCSDDVCAVDPWATDGEISPMARLHLILGPVGAGKSTLALQLCRDHRAVRLNLDEWMAVLFSEDRPDAGAMDWYIERTNRCIDQIWTLSARIIDAGTDVVLEIGLIQRGRREQFYRRVDGAGYDLNIYVLDAHRDVRRERVERRNQDRGATFSMVVPDHIFDLASDMWESPDEVECRGRHVQLIRTDE